VSKGHEAVLAEHKKDIATLTNVVESLKAERQELITEKLALDEMVANLKTVI
jgi:hypothetical protein